MSRPRPKRGVATLRAVMWLNTFRESLSTGVLRIDPRLSEGRTKEIERELATFRDAQLPRINRDLGISPDVYATVHLKRWEEDLAAETAVERYPLTRLLKEQQLYRDGAESLRRALEIMKSEDLSDADNCIILRMVLAQAESLLVSGKSNPEPTPVPGVVGERLQDCEEAIEAVLDRLNGLRENAFELDDAANLSVTCAILYERAFQLAKQIRDTGPV